MVKVKYVQVLIKRNEHLSHPVTVPPWEVPVLQEVHSGSLFKELGERIVSRKIRPTARDEFERLSNRYKHSGDSEVPYVARVYGVGRIALENLERAIASAVVGEQNDKASANRGDAGEAPAYVDPATLAFLTEGKGAEDAPQEITA